MKKKIYIGRNASGRYVKLDDGSIPQYSGDIVHEIANFLGVDVPMNEKIQLIHDTETGLTTIKKERKIGWYLGRKRPVVSSMCEYVCAYHWNGENFAARRTNNSPFEFITYHESELEIDERPLSSHLFKGLE